MDKKLKRFLFVPLTACLCTISISYAQADSGKNSSSHAGAPGQNKVYVCRIIQSNKFKTKLMPEHAALKLVENKPDNWILGKCDDVISPS